MHNRSSIIHRYLNVLVQYTNYKVQSFTNSPKSISSNMMSPRPTYNDFKKLPDDSTQFYPFPQPSTSIYKSLFDWTTTYELSGRGNHGFVTNTSLFPLFSHTALSHYDSNGYSTYCISFKILIHLCTTFSWNCSARSRIVLEPTYRLTFNWRTLKSYILLLSTILD